MKDTIYSLAELFSFNAFRIPQYQRAYSWDVDPQLSAFLEDLRQQVKAKIKDPHKHYYYGTFLLHEEDLGGGKSIVNVVDGQQRITTAIIFFAKALALHSAGRSIFDSENTELLRRTFIHDEVAGTQKFHTIKEDDPYFRSKILEISCTDCPAKSASMRRLQDSYDFFEKAVKLDEWESLVKALKTAQVMVYVVNSPKDATQIFELQNDRGKSLTSLEALKSFLMHCIYLHSAEQAANDRLSDLQNIFSKIYRTVESLEDLQRVPDEDQILVYHCTAFLKWTDKNEYSNPKKLVKSSIKSLEEMEVVPWIEQFVGSMVDSYQTIHDLFEQRDELIEFTELLMLGRMASFWPLVLKAWRYDKTPNKQLFRTTCRLLEVFSFRGYAVANLRSDTRVADLHAAARTFDGNFRSLYSNLCDMCHGHDLDRRFAAGLDSAYYFHAEGSDGRYLLWRYENYLRDQPGKIQPILSWRDYLEPRNHGAKFSAEHIASQNHPLSQKVVSWTEGEEKPFREVALHRLGNLVLDSISPNASKSNDEYADKLVKLSEDSQYLSQGELIRFVKDRTNPVWDIEAVRLRHKHMIEYAMKTWNPKTWFSP